MTAEALCQKAIEAMSKAYCPYSHCRVGAAVETSDSLVYTGCNIENAAYSSTICAERTALFKAISEGHRRFIRLAVCGGYEGKIAGIYPPCGVCRQVMSEFCPGSFEILLISSVDPLAWQMYTLDELLPFRFSSSDMDHE